MNYKAKKSKEMTLLTFSGDLTVDHANKLKRALLTSVQKVGRVTIRLEDVARVDLSCLQLLCSAHRSSMQLGKHLGFTGPVPLEVKRFMIDAGYCRHIGCALGTEYGSSCLWLED